MTERTSKRAARERLRVMLEEVGNPPTSPQTDTPLPNPPPQGGRERTECPATVAPQAEAPHFLPPAPTKLEQTAPDLTAIVRALYEEGVVPVIEIARLAGVSERTFYKYVARGAWKRRDAKRGPAVAAANRGRPFRRPEGFTQRRGSGGRFLGAGEEDTGACGLKALDAAGRAQAAAQGEALARVSSGTLARVEAQRLASVNARAFAEVVRFAREVVERERGGR